MADIIKFLQLKRGLVLLFSVPAVCFFAVSLISCNSPGPGIKTKSSIAEETLIQARDQGFDYQGNFDCSLMAKAQCLEGILKFSLYADTAGGIGHGIALLEIIEKIGERRFFQVLNSLQLDPDINIKKSIHQSLEIGLSYVQKKKFANLPQNYPELQQFMKNYSRQP